MHKEGFTISVFIATEVLSSKLYQSITAECQGRGEAAWAGLSVSWTRGYWMICLSAICRLMVLGSVCAQVSWRHVRVLSWVCSFFTDRQVKMKDLLQTATEAATKSGNPPGVCPVCTANTATTCCGVPLLSSDRQPRSGLMLGSTFLPPAPLPSAVPSVHGLAVVSAARCEAVDINASCAACIQVND